MTANELYQAKLKELENELENFKKDLLKHAEAQKKHNTDFGFLGDLSGALTQIQDARHYIGNPSVYYF